MELKSKTKSFLRDERGNFSIILAVSASCLLVSIGAALDASSLMSRKSNLQHATDMAVLAAAASGETKKKDLRSVAKLVFDENFELKKNESLESLTLKLSSDDEIVVATRLSKPTVFMSLIGKKDVAVSAEAASPLASSSPLDIALVLDRTGSMAGTKMAGLITASRDFITELGNSSQDVRVSVVPFSDYVNIGAGNAGQVWLDLAVSGGSGSDVTCEMENTALSTCSTPSSTSTSSSGSTSPSSSSGTGCSISMSGTTPTGSSSSFSTTTASGISVSCSVNVGSSTGGTMIWSDVVTNSNGAYCSMNTDPQESSGSMVEECTPQVMTENWFGCVGSRTAPYNIQAGYNGQKVPPVFDRTCGQPLTELTNNLSAASADISALTASGSTYIPAGLQWGWRTLKRDAPFNLNGNPNRKKLLILMTDGQNTRSQLGNIHNGNDYAGADALTQSLCTEIKDSGIMLATVSYSNGGSSSTNSAMLSECASSSNLHFDATNAADLKKAFSGAAQNINEVRLIR